MKIAIHHDRDSFSERWIDYCKENNIEFKLVDCFSNDIVKQLNDFKFLMWNWNQTNATSIKFARQIIKSLELGGKIVFPNSSTCWHFDDKVAQKYLFESLNIPHVLSSVFYDEMTANMWIDSVPFPKVFKLKGGAGSMNVELVYSKSEAKKIVRKAFSTGFSPINQKALFEDSIDNFKKNRTFSSFISIVKRTVRLFIKNRYENMADKEKSYVYFQEFIPNNDFDIRVIVIGDRAFAIKRMCRTGDFRASGSGKIIYDRNQIDDKCIKLAFDTSKKLHSQSTAYDFVFDKEENPLIVEISYSFAMYGYDQCPGYWDNELNWYDEAFNPQYWILENLIKDGYN